MGNHWSLEADFKRQDDIVGWFEKELKEKDAAEQRVQTLQLELNALMQRVNEKDSDLASIKAMRKKESQSLLEEKDASEGMVGALQKRVEELVMHLRD
jgi:hypothetical protein